MRAVPTVSLVGVDELKELHPSRQH